LSNADTDVEISLMAKAACPFVVGASFVDMGELVTETYLYLEFT
jgi:hypothetical protein